MSDDFPDVDAMLADARSRIERLDPAAASRRLAGGALLVDIRPAWQRADEGEIPGAYVVERNHLEWRVHPASDARLTAAGERQDWIVICSAGYTSSLAAASLRSLGVDAADVVGGYAAWRDAGLPVQRSVTEHDQRVGSAG